MARKQFLSTMRTVVIAFAHLKHTAKRHVNGFVTDLELHDAATVYVNTVRRVAKFGQDR